MDLFQEQGKFLPHFWREGEWNVKSQVKHFIFWGVSLI